MNKVLNTILNFKLNFGYKINLKTPLMGKYTKGKYKKISIIDENKTLFGIKRMLFFLNKSKGKSIFVSTKTQHISIVKRYISKLNIFFVLNKWIGGTLTNSSIIGNFCSKLPEFLIIIDSNKNKSAFLESNKKKIKSISITGSHFYKRGSMILPINDDSELSLELLFKIIYYFFKRLKIRNLLTFNNKNNYYYFKKLQNCLFILKIITKSDFFVDSFYFKYNITKIFNNDLNFSNINKIVKNLSNYYKEHLLFKFQFKKFLSGNNYSLLLYRNKLPILTIYKNFNIKTNIISKNILFNVKNILNFDFYLINFSNFKKNTICDFLINKNINIFKIYVIS
ncbi:MAG: 30S ribosomal protein S2 [Candidatus Vidania fulgoroideorum]